MLPKRISTNIIDEQERGVALFVEDYYNPRKIQTSGVRCAVDQLIPIHESNRAPIPLPTEGQRIIEVSISKGRLRIVDNDTEVFGADVATGKKGFETPRGQFPILRRRWARRMRGTIDGEYNIPRIPWVNYFTN